MSDREKRYSEAKRALFDRFNSIAREFDEQNGIKRTSTSTGHRDSYILDLVYEMMMEFPKEK